MKKSLWTVLSILLVASVLLTACGTPAPTQAPATEPPAATEAPATEAPATEAPAEPVEVTLWHAYGTGSAEETALTGLIEQAKTDLPNITINVLQVPFNDIFNKYRTDVAAGAGPDMFVAPNDSLGDDARNGLIADITDLAAGKLGDYTQLSIDGMTVEGKLYGIPESLKAVVLWYNKDLLATPPATTDELKAQMEAGTPTGLAFGCYHHFGFFNAFGGKIFDENWKIVADQGTGVADAMTYLKSLYDIAETNGWPRTDTDELAPFTDGTLASITNGNWAMGDYRTALGDKLGVAPLPAGPAGPSKPMMGIDGWYINPNSKNKEAAVAFALYAFSKDGLTLYADNAGDPAARSDVAAKDPLVKAFADVAAGGFPRPQSKEFGNYWGAFGDAVTAVVSGKAQPADAVKTACETMNKANGK
jgi:arabinogalactan oligomer/maltooligosaccharide transport system substrate-binding protein